MSSPNLTRRSATAGLLSIAFVSPAFAHRLARTESEVRISEGGTIGVIHVYHLKDAQTALFEAGLISSPDMDSLKARAILSLYTQDKFTLSFGDIPSKLAIIDAQIEGDSIYVYQEGQAGEGPLTVDARMLRDLIPSQRNSVNIIRGGNIITVDFALDDGPKSVA